MPSAARGTARRLGALAVLLPYVLSCNAVPTDPGGQPVAYAKASSDPVVTSADPAAATRDTTLDVRVLGSGFDAGSSADFLLDGAAVPGVTTNRTSYLSSRELVANVTIAADAVPERYDIRVTTSRGKKGIGTEKFQVLDVVDLGSLGGVGGRATSINRLGQVVGNAARPDGQLAPFFWSDGTMQALPVESGWTFTGTNDLNDAGVVVGGAYDGVNWIAHRWTPSASGWIREAMPTLPGYEGGSAHALHINDAGDVAGFVSKVGLQGRMTIWRDGVVYPVNLSAAGLSGNSISVDDLTESGWIVGSANLNALRSAFVWRPDGSGVPGQGITVWLPRHGSGVNSALGMTESGVVVGYVITSKSTVAVRWRPLTSIPLVTADYVVEALTGSAAYAWDIGDDGFIVGQQNGAAAHWTQAGTLGFLPVLQRAGGLGASVQVVGGRHWVAGESAVGGKLRATLWRVP
jgi:probable HAF family extracellular repeat protein